MEEMELQSVRSYFRSLQKVSQVKVLFIVQYIMLSSSSPGWTQTSHRLISAEDGWLGGKTPFFFDGKCKAFGHEPKKTHDYDSQGHMYIYTQAAPESSSRTPGGRLKKQKHIPPIIQSYTTDHQSEYSVENATTELQSEEYWRCCKKTRRIHDKVHMSRLLWPWLHEGVAVWCHTTMASCEGCHYSTVVWSRPATCSLNAASSNK